MVNEAAVTDTDRFLSVACLFLEVVTCTSYLTSGVYYIPNKTICISEELIKRASFVSRKKDSILLKSLTVPEKENYIR